MNLIQMLGLVLIAAAAGALSVLQWQAWTKRRWRRNWHRLQARQEGEL